MQRRLYYLFLTLRLLITIVRFWFCCINNSLEWIILILRTLTTCSLVCFIAVDVKTYIKLPSDETEKLSNPDDATSHLWLITWVGGTLYSLPSITGTLTNVWASAVSCMQKGADSGELKSASDLWGSSYIIHALRCLQVSQGKHVLVFTLPGWLLVCCMILMGELAGGWWVVTKNISAVLLTSIWLPISIKPYTPWYRLILFKNDAR